jgi:hypothetical protein
MADLIVGPNGTAMPINQMRVHKLTLPAGKVAIHQNRFNFKFVFTNLKY